MSRKSHLRPLAQAKLDVPRLAIGGPVTIGIGIFAMLLGGGIYWSATHQIDRVLKAEGRLDLADKVTSLRQTLGGGSVRLYVGKGDAVKAGQLVARLSNAALDAKIAKLRSKAGRSRTRLAIIRAEAARVIGGRARRQGDGSKNVGALAKQVAAVEAEAAVLNALITKTRKKISKSEIRAPVAGRIGWVIDNAPGRVVEAGQEILRLRTPAKLLTVKALLASKHAKSLAPGLTARVVLTDKQGRRLNDLAARLSALKRYETSAAPGSHALHSAVFVLTAPRSQITNEFSLQSDVRAEILIHAGRQNLLEHLTGPLPHWLKSASVYSSWVKAFNHDNAE